MKRVKIDPKSLMRIVLGVTIGVTVFLIVWSVVDGTCATKNLDLVHESEQAVILSYSCASSSDGWKIAALTWEFFLLLCASVLAFQTRKAEHLFSESTFLSMLVYSHFFFAVLRAIVNFLDSMPSNDKAGIVSLLLSVDTIISIAIYFGKKFLAAYHHEDPSLTRGPSSISRFSETSSFHRSAMKHQQQGRVVSFCLNENDDSDDHCDSLAGSSSHQRRQSTDLNSLDLHVGSRSNNGELTGTCSRYRESVGSSVLKKKENSVAEDIESDGSALMNDEKKIDNDEEQRQRTFAS